MIVARANQRLVFGKERPGIGRCALGVNRISPFISAFIFRNGLRSRGGKQWVSMQIVIQDRLADPDTQWPAATARAGSGWG
jgi:hypothetical protein